MQNEPKTPRISDDAFQKFAGSPVVEIEVIRLTQKLRQDAHLPIDICIDSQRLEKLKHLPFSASGLIAKEIKLWGALIGHHPVNNLLFNTPFEVLEPFELTEILHALATSFKLSENKTRTFRVTVAPGAITEDHIALLKGLGFNHVQIVLNHDEIEDIETLINAKIVLNSFSIKDISFLIRKLDLGNALQVQIKQLKDHVEPNFIQFGNRPSLQHKNHSCDADAIVFDDDSLSQQNLLCLGPEASSYLEQVELQSICKPEVYCFALRRNRLPLAPRYKLSQ